MHAALGLAVFWSRKFDFVVKRHYIMSHWDRKIRNIFLIHNRHHQGQVLPSFIRTSTPTLNSAQETGVIDFLQETDKDEVVIWLVMKYTRLMWPRNETCYRSVHKLIITEARASNFYQNEQSVSWHRSQHIKLILHKWFRVIPRPYYTLGSHLQWFNYPWDNLLNTCNCN